MVAKFLRINRLSAYMVDLLVEYRLERKRLLLAVNENIIYKMVRDIGCYDLARFSMLSSELVQIYEIPEEMANYIVSVFSYALFGKKTQNVCKKTELKHNANSELITSSVDFTELISLDKYTGNESTVVVPNRISAIGNEAF